MNILVIGNGFDLAHGLPTMYWDFLMFTKVFKIIENKTEAQIRIMPMFKKLNVDIQEFLLQEEIRCKDKRVGVWKEFDELLSGNIWMKHFDNKADEYRDKGWIDFESEISDVIKSIDYGIRFTKYDIEKSHADYPDSNIVKENLFNDFINKYERLKNSDELKKSVARCLYGENVKKFVDDIYNDLSGLIRCLEIYLGKVIEEYYNVKTKVPEIEKLKIDKVLSFNYSHTYNKYYEDSNTIEYDYIHGEVDTHRDIENNNMVLGIDEYLSDEERNERLELIKFKKYFQRIYKKTGCIYKRWIEEMKSEYKQYINAKKAVGDLAYISGGEEDINNETKEILKNNGGKHNIFIIGHSLDVTDKEILSDLILLENATITIFYYDEKAYTQQIGNLVKLIGQDTLIDMVYGSNPKIIFEKQIKIENK